MAVHAQISIDKDCKDIDKAKDWTEEVKELLLGNVEGSFSTNISNSSKPEELTKEQESE